MLWVRLRFWNKLKKIKYLSLGIDFTYYSNKIFVLKIRIQRYELRVYDLEYDLGYMIWGIVYI